MDAEALVISCDLAKALHAAGVVQESYWIWYELTLFEQTYAVLGRWDQPPKGWKIYQTYAAFTLGELIALLGHRFGGVHRYRSDTPFRAEHHYDFRYSGQGTTPQDAVGQLLLAVQDGKV